MNNGMNNSINNGINNRDRAYDVLLLDFGGVCLLTPFEMHRHLERVTGLEPNSVTWMGPYDPASDDLWSELLVGTALDGTGSNGSALHEREYWSRRAQMIGTLIGRPLSTSDYMRLLYEPPRNELVRHEAEVVVKAAQSGGVAVSVLTNDLRAFHGNQWEKSIPLLQAVDHIVDCSDTGILKPDPRAYQRAQEIVGVPAGRILFVDDQPLNVEGARAAGIDAFHFDVTQPTESWNRVRALVGV